MSETRKCDNWLLSFRDWSLPRSEAPESFHFWAGLFTIASVLKRRVYVSEELLGGWDCYPFMYIIFVAPPGVARKSTTARYAENLLSSVPLVNLAPTAITVEKLIKELERVKDSAISVFSSEFSSFIILDMFLPDECDHMISATLMGISRSSNGMSSAAASLMEVWRAPALVMSLDGRTHIMSWFPGEVEMSRATNCPQVSPTIR